MEDAKKRARKLIDDLAVGKVHVATFTLKQTAAITDAVEILRPVGISITEAARQVAEAHRILGDIPITQAAILREAQGTGGPKGRVAAYHPAGWS